MIKQPTSERTDRFQANSQYVPHRPDHRGAHMESAIGSVATPSVRCAIESMAATSMAICAVAIMGLFAWPVLAGIPGIALAVAVGAAAGAAFPRPAPRIARVVTGGLGGLVAGYFALASAEVVTPGTLAWALAASGYAALFALPVAAIVGGVTGLVASRTDHRRGRLQQEPRDATT
jgi:hypothetical protein